MKIKYTVEINLDEQNYRKKFLSTGSQIAEEIMQNLRGLMFDLTGERDGASEEGEIITGTSISLMSVEEDKPLDLRSTFIALEDTTVAINKLLSLVSASRRAEKDWEALYLHETGDVVTEFITNLIHSGITEIQPLENGEPF